MIKVGDKLPGGTVVRVHREGRGLQLGPNLVDVAKATAGKTIAIFGVPGALRRRARCSMRRATSTRRRPSRRCGRNLVRGERRVRDGRLGS